MADHILDLTDQATKLAEIQPQILQLRNQMELRKAHWQVMREHAPKEAKRWVQEDNDAIMSLAWSIFKYLHWNFFYNVFEEGDTDGG